MREKRSRRRRGREVEVAFIAAEMLEGGYGGSVVESFVAQRELCTELEIFPNQFQCVTVLVSSFLISVEPVQRVYNPGTYMLVQGCDVEILGARH